MFRELSTLSVRIEESSSHSFRAWVMSPMRSAAGMISMRGGRVHFWRLQRQMKRERERGKSKGKEKKKKKQEKCP
jgi:hypothetical protein